jgi:hypothetical protein
VTWPSLAITVLPSRRTMRTVVEWVVVMERAIVSGKGLHSARAASKTPLGW